MGGIPRLCAVLAAVVVTATACSSAGSTNGARSGSSGTGAGGSQGCAAPSTVVFADNHPVNVLAVRPVAQGIDAFGQLEKQCHTTVKVVEYGNGAEIMNALVGGQVDYMCADVVTAAPQLQAGTIKAYAIASTSRNPAIPTVPTTSQAGLPEFQASGWFALFAPKGTPKPILDRLTDALDRALDDDGTRKRLTELANDVPEKSRRGQQALRVLLKDEIARWTLIIRAANVKAE